MYVFTKVYPTSFIMPMGYHHGVPFITIQRLGGFILFNLRNSIFFRSHAVHSVHEICFFNKQSLKYWCWTSFFTRFFFSPFSFAIFMLSVFLAFTISSVSTESIFSRSPRNSFIRTPSMWSFTFPITFLFSALK